MIHFFLSLFSFGGRRGGRGGRKVRIRAGRVSWSNRGGVRVRTSRHTSVGRTGVRVNAKAGPLRATAGKTGVRLAAVKRVGPVTVSANKAGIHGTVSASLGGRSTRPDANQIRLLQQEIEQATERARQNLR